MLVPPQPQDGHHRYPRTLLLNATCTQCLGLEQRHRTRGAPFVPGTVNFIALSSRL